MTEEESSCSGNDVEPQPGRLCGFNFFTSMSELCIDSHSTVCYKHVSFDGAVAQLGERLNGIQEVVSSILISSTINQKGPANRRTFFC